MDGGGASSGDLGQRGSDGAVLICALPLIAHLSRPQSRGLQGRSSPSAEYFNLPSAASVGQKNDSALFVELSPSPISGILLFYLFAFGRSYFPQKNKLFPPGVLKGIVRLCPGRAEMIFNHWKLTSDGSV
ncbi:hypothetical protein CEXT_28801 [Caerostris extrusa]|uniref:Uncharacterized protein n=1 Tax=Caerostris extrusa TaxID=172846 RepID=A0AAV4RQV5_CAEEX|nr:hypothetical protein CEXT_28801 [Caerostris extrusa]